MVSLPSSSVVEIAAAVSGKVCHVFPTFARAGRILDDGRTIEIAFSAEPVGNDIDGFWPGDCTLSSEEKRRMFWQYHRSTGCDRYVAVLARVFKDLCDAGVSLAHEGKKVVDILVLNASEFDVSDLLAARGKDDGALKVHDAATDVTLPIIATHEAMDRMIGLGEAFCARLGLQLPPPEDGNREILKRHRPESYTGAVPHWWIAVVVEGDIAGNKTYNMVHLDICGAAYNKKALVEAPGSDDGDRLVSLETFVTPEYQMIPNSDKRLQHKLVMKAITSPRGWNPLDSAKQCTRVVLQPKSIRHFRCYHKDDTSSIEVTPLETFLERNQFSDNEGVKISEMVLSIQQDIVLKLPVGSEVVVCNIKSKPELNGRPGTIYKSSKRDRIASNRIPVLIRGQKVPVQLKATCIRLPAVLKRQYQTLDEKNREHNQSLKEEYDEAKNISFTKMQKSQINSALEDPAAIKALSVIQTGQLVFTSYGDAEFKKGVEMFLRPPLDAVIPKSMQRTIRNGWELSNHPKANDAIKLINLMKAAKLRLAEHPDNRDSLMSDLMRIQMSVVKKIQSDKGLSFVFGRLDELGFYVNPVKVYANLGLG